jgi:hypothetical protein
LFGHEAVGTQFGSVARLAGARAKREKALAKRANRKRVFIMGGVMGSNTERRLCFLGESFGFGAGEGEGSKVGLMACIRFLFATIWASVDFVVWYLDLGQV